MVDMGRIREGLEVIKDMMIKGEITHHSVGGKFNMLYWHDNGCNTAVCIGGWLQKLGYIQECPAQNIELNRLFYPDAENAPITYAHVTVQQGIQAIDNYLLHGSPMWSKVFEDGDKQGAAK